MSDVRFDFCCPGQSRHVADHAELARIDPKAITTNRPIIAEIPSSIEAEG